MTNSTSSSNSMESNKSKTSSKAIQSSQLMKLFEEELKDIYWVENTLLKAIPEMIKNATSNQLIKALENHLEETKNQVTRLDQVFEKMGKKASSKKCEAMAGLIKEAEAVMKDCEEGSMRDAAIILSAQKVEHYEIASYGTLRQFAETLGLTEAVDLLEATLDEEKVADEELSSIATSAINVDASQMEA